MKYSQLLKQKKSSALSGALGNIAASVLEGVRASLMIKDLRNRWAELQAGDQVAHVFLFEARIALRFCQENPGVAAPLVYLLAVEWKDWLTPESVALTLAF